MRISDWSSDVCSSDLYTPLHAGIFWDLREPMLDDLDRIEVISASGGTLWGPNAVNGVINIISKSALDTQGGVVRGTASTRERTAAVRYGSTETGRAPCRERVDQKVEFSGAAR